MKVSTGKVVAAARGRLWMTLLPMMACFAVAVAVLGANPFAHQTVGPFDLLASQGAWIDDVPPVPVRNMERSDVLDWLLPSWLHAREVLRAGSLPIWDPVPKGGQRGMQNLVYSELTPAFAIFAASPSPPLGFYLATLFNLTVLGWGGFFWLRRRLSSLPALLGGLALMLCGFHAAWLYWPHTMTSMWIAWLLWAVDCWWENPRYKQFLGMVVFSALLILGGFPFVSLLGFGAVVLYLLCLMFKDSRSRWQMRIAGFVLALVASAGLCAVPLLSFARWLSDQDISLRHGGSPLQLFGDLHYLLPHFARSEPHVESTMYVGVVVLLAGITGWLIVIVRRLRVPVMGLFPLLLGLIGLTLVFEIIPDGYLAWVPGLSNNAWSRAIILLDMSLAAAAAYALDEWRRRVNSRALFVGAMLVLTGCQVLDTGSLFRQFNGPIADSYFYPRDKLITYVQDHIGPFQSVVADNNFLVSGTLGAYGIHEWLAHGFNSPFMVANLAQLADHPFTTPTATAIEAEGFHLASPMMAALGIRYAMGDSGLSYDSLTPVFQGDASALPPNQPIPPLPDHSVTQKFSLDHDYRLVVVTVRLATYGESGLKGQVALQLYRDNFPAPLARVALDASSIRDNMMASFQLPVPLDLAPGKYSFTLNYSDGGQNKLTAWYKPADATNCSLVIDGNAMPGCLDMQLSRLRSSIGPFVTIASNHGIQLLENTEVPSGPYFVERLDQWPDRGSSSSVVVRNLKSHDFDLEYSGTRAGYVVVPMNIVRGWRVTLDGRVVQPANYLGGLPAVKVNAGASIKFRYMPYSIQYGKWISLLTLLILLLAASIVTWRGRSSRASAEPGPG
ncbi:hypothetical protein [Rhodanobacter sp. C01]|uniref:hypothetical protein n=1 Tax=Rhodanobacter sp. C01 TaxID=1945856 RepID=UPI0009858B4B|nr:hypothetical protein [Rhodanobacter sp. C01]OOG51067.1 hypothetical protein B0E50_02520 [Rhodanobacter sp. C01]